MATIHPKLGRGLFEDLGESRPVASETLSIIELNLIAICARLVTTRGLTPRRKS
jgi:hypothetical protein